MLGGLFRCWLIKLFGIFEFLGDGILASEQESACSPPPSGLPTAIT